MSNAEDFDGIPEGELVEALVRGLSEPESTAPDVAPIGALRQWRAEVRAGVDGQHPERPSTWRHDPLFLAACWEAAGLEAKSAGLPRAAAVYFERAAEAIVQAVAERAA